MDKYRRSKRKNKRPSYLNVADAIGAANPCSADLFALLTKLIQDTSTNNAAIPRHTYFVSPSWNEVQLPKQFYTDIQDAIDAIVADAGGAPSVTDKYQIILFPGHYSRTGGYTLASNVNIVGSQSSSVYVDSPVVWTPGSYSNANRLTESEEASFQDIVFTAGFTETVNAAKPLAAVTYSSFDSCELLVGDYTFTLRADLQADYISMFNVLSECNLLQFSNGGNILIEQSRIDNVLPVRMVGDITNLNMVVASTDNKIITDLVATDVEFTLSGCVLFGAWTVGGRSVFEMVNCACNNTWTLAMTDSAHADIWSSPHNSEPGNDAVSCAGTSTVHRDVVNLTTVLGHNAFDTTVVPLLPMLDTNYIVNLAGNFNRNIYWSAKTTNSFTISAGSAVVNPTTVDVQVCRIQPNLNLV